ncbi:MAG TPA: ABC transporter permease [Opitutales bacterium]|jgi:lipopolysaccharide transport system permease protein|nr:ABC transporter permease [Opitutales bacterium]
MNTDTAPLTLLLPRGQTNLAEWRELWAARDLAWFLVKRDLKTRYSQSILGLGWAVVQPLFTTVVMTVIFGTVAGLSALSDPVPYSVWSLTAVVVMTFFQGATNEVGNCLAANMGVITKVYFPRLVLPLVSLLGRVFDLGIMLTMLALTLLGVHGLLLARGCHLQLCAIWVVPMALGVTGLAALAMGLWLAGLSVQYRDVRAAQGLMLQLLMYASPVIYPASQVILKLQDPKHHIPTWLVDPLSVAYYLNPLAGAIEAMRAALFSQESVSYTHLAMGAVTAVIGLIGGLWCFRRAETIVADVG